MRATPFLILRYALVLVIGAALSSVSLAHQVSKPDAQLSAFFAAGGTLDDLCGMESREGLDPSDCEACRLVDAVYLAGNACGSAFEFVTIAIVGHAAAQVASLPRDPAHPGRAPPVV